jgi:hypothetical protein
MAEVGRMAQAEPFGQHNTVLVRRRCGNPVAALAGVVGTLQDQVRILALNLAASYRAHDHCVFAPGVIHACIASGLECAIEFGLHEVAT